MRKLPPGIHTMFWCCSAPLTEACTGAIGIALPPLEAFPALSVATSVSNAYRDLPEPPNQFHRSPKVATAVSFAPRARRRHLYGGNWRVTVNCSSQVSLPTLGRTVL